MEPDITVIVATFNRARELATTLEGLVRAERGNPTVEFVIVNNGSTDETEFIVDLFRDRLPINYIFEPRPGKNRALNTALEKCKLGKIVVFTDDDIDVSSDWFVSIRSVSDRWPKHSVFGGRVTVVFPFEKVPKWTSDPYISSVCFAHHSYSDKECIYEGAHVPFGGNLWVRREVFLKGWRFDEKIGPRPTNRIMGSETSFLLALKNDGYEIVYSPEAVVGHRIKPEVLRFSALCLKAYQHGRSIPYLHGLPRLTLLGKFPARWRLWVSTAIMWNIMKIAGMGIFSWKQQRIINIVNGIEHLTFYVEALRLGRDRRMILGKMDSH
jgi:glycosyltransferase involved in cell wall biosynthesis